MCQIAEFKSLEHQTADFNILEWQNREFMSFEFKLLQLTLTVVSHVDKSIVGLALPLHLGTVHCGSLSI